MNTTSVRRFAGVGLSAVILCSQAIAQGVPFEDILDRLDAQASQLTLLQEVLGSIDLDIDALQSSVDEVSFDVDLSGVTQVWDKKLDSTDGGFDGCDSQRFTCIWDGSAVRDNETGLVWERAPDAALTVWNLADHACANVEVDGRKGWALPSRTQLATLLDQDGDGVNLFLPMGHPFANVQPFGYWSANDVIFEPTAAYSVNFGLTSFGGGNVNASTKATIEYHRWCVRSG